MRVRGRGNEEERMKTERGEGEEEWKDGGRKDRKEGRDMDGESGTKGRS